MGRGPYYTISQAAEYCGYRSAKYFRRLAEEYGVPVKGPHGNRYAEADLDAFMERPESFLAPRTQPRAQSWQLTL